MDDLTFRCQGCQQDIPADPDTMLEVQTGVLAIKDVEVPADIKVLLEDHEPGLSGDYGICLCHDCQEAILLSTV